jgi:hypothetical protein
MKFWSQAKQDEVALELLDFKRNGYFVDIGCAAPFRLSNTATMEVELGWKGLGFDLKIENPEHNELNEGDVFEGGGRSWTERPNTKTFEGDILSLDLEKIFADEGVPEVVDFLNVDLEPWQPTFQAFKNLPHDKHKFRVIAFEHDGYRSGMDWVTMTNSYITGLGYKFHCMLNGQDNIYILEE